LFWPTRNRTCGMRDFYLQVLAGLYGAMFWFSPLGWWLKRKLSELGEAISDLAGLEEAASRIVLRTTSCRIRGPAAPNPDRSSHGPHQQSLSSYRSSFGRVHFPPGICGQAPLACSPCSWFRWLCLRPRQFSAWKPRNRRNRLWQSERCNPRLLLPHPLLHRLRSRSLVCPTLTRRPLPRRQQHLWRPRHPT
jgi:hypothetical protein